MKKITKKDLYTEIHNLISKNPSMIFSFIYDLEEDKNKKNNICSRRQYKNYLISKLEENKNENKDNLFQKL